jgi:hypothetical protein
VAFEPQPNPNSLNVNSQTVVNFLPNYSAYVYSSAAPKYAEFKVKYQVYTNSPPPDVQRANDSCVFYQRFYNYYAYDDGMPEAGYGLSISDGRLAYQFTLDVPDTLKSIQMFFNQTIGNANQQYFYLTVWDDNNGIPGSVIYEQSGRRPEFEGDLFRYHTYELNEPLAVTGTFYIGWRQTTKDNLNIGYDFNNPQGDKIFYNVTGNWYNVSWQGSLMMRPILGEKANAHVGIEDEKVLDKNQSLHIFPNPASDQVQIQLQGIDNTSDLQIEVWNLQGEIVRRQQFENTISVSDLSSGVYIIQVYNTAKGIRLMQKLIISR